MHIVYITVEFVSERKPCGGLGHYLANIATIMAERGHQVTILVQTDHGGGYFWKPNVEVITYTIKDFELASVLEKITRKFILKDNLYFLYTGSITTREVLKRLDKKKKIDIVQYCGNDLSILFRHKKIPSVVRLSSFTPQYEEAIRADYDPENEKWIEEKYSKLFYIAYHRADAIFGPSKVVADIIKKNTKLKVKIIESPCIIEKNKFIELKMDKLINKKYFLFFGTLNRLKGVEVIRDSIYKILSIHKDILFVLAGRQENSKTVMGILEAAAEYKDRVIYLGEIKNSDSLYGIIKNAYACILPSLIDNLPNTCIEAMGNEKIVIGTYGASFEQLIKHKKSGLLIKRNSPSALIMAVNYLMNMSDEQRYEMEKKAGKRVERMNPERIYNQLITFYQDIINRKAKKNLNRGERR
jgi:glycosyltransferase involved in cell wall biosynthesis